MANEDTPYGFMPIEHLMGCEFKTREYTVTTGQTIYRGDPVKLTSAGTVSVAAANDGVNMIGVAAQAVDDSASAGGKKIQVWDDPFLIFKVQATTGQTPAAADVFGTADMITYAAGNTTTKQSIMELAAIGTSTGDFFVMGKVESPDNAWGEHVKLKVRFNLHAYRGAAHAGV